MHVVQCARLIALPCPPPSVFVSRLSCSVSSFTLILHPSSFILHSVFRPPSFVSAVLSREAFILHPSSFIFRLLTSGYQSDTIEL